MTNAAKVGWLLTVIGLAGALIAAVADPLGIGGHPDFGWKQIVGVVAGLAAVGVGQALRLKGSARRPED